VGESSFTRRVWHLGPSKGARCSRRSRLEKPLGRRHHVSPRALAAQEIVPRLSDRYPHQHLAAFSRGTSIHINGMGNAAQEWAALLEQLTLRSDLHQLTLHWWLGDSFSRGHLRTYPAWCTACYTAWTEQALPLYQPLLWMLRVVKLCPRHQRWLQDRCSHCRNYQSVIASKKMLCGYCTQCNTWLGMAPGAEEN